MPVSASAALLLSVDAYIAQGARRDDNMVFGLPHDAEIVFLDVPFQLGGGVNRMCVPASFSFSPSAASALDNSSCGRRTKELLLLGAPFPRSLKYC